MGRLDRRISLVALVVIGCGSAADAETIRDAILAYLDDARQTAHPGLAGARTLAEHPLADGTIGGYFIEAYRHDGLEILRLTGVIDTDGHSEHGFRIRVVRKLGEPWRVERVDAYSEPLPEPNA